ncbi:MAG: YihY/virulence factor BrkB family protein [Verrucomicrobia bacterium]|nr:YihY/virulence factor BrkB family protein [Verrucomicrobiota bacterium]
MRFFSLLKTAFDQWVDDGALRLSAALAFYSMFSLSPLVVVAISVAGLVLGEEAVRGQLQDQLRIYIGAPAAASLESLISSAAVPAESWGGAVTGFCTMLLGASGVFGQLKDALNTIWEVPPKPFGGLREFLHERLLSFGMVLIVGFLLLTSLLLGTALTAFGGWLERAIGVPTFVGLALGALVPLFVVSLLFAGLFKGLPDAQIRWRQVWLGAVTTAVLFEIGKWILSWYLARAGTTSSFGAAGSLVVVLLWVYYSSCILLFGAEFTKAHADALNAEASQPAPEALEPVLPLAAERPPNLAPRHAWAGWSALALLTLALGLLVRRMPTAEVEDGPAAASKRPPEPPIAR